MPLPRSSRCTLTHTNTVGNLHKMAKKQQERGRRNRRTPLRPLDHAKLKADDKSMTSHHPEITFGMLHFYRVDTEAKLNQSCNLVDKYYLLAIIFTYKLIK